MNKIYLNEIFTKENLKKQKEKCFNFVKRNKKYFTHFGCFITGTIIGQKLGKYFKNKVGKNI